MIMYVVMLFCITEKNNKEQLQQSIFSTEILAHFIVLKGWFSSHQYYSENIYLVNKMLIQNTKLLYLYIVMSHFD